MVAAKVKLYASLRKYSPDIPLGEPAAINLPSGFTIQDLIEHFGISQNEVKLGFVNGIQRDPEYVIQDGDDIALFPPIAGGSLI